MPVNMPAYAFTSLGVGSEVGSAYARSEGGLFVTSRKADPFWNGPMTTQPLQGWQGNNQHADFLAFLTNCVDRNLRVDFVHPRHRLPSAYTDDTWPMAGDASLNAVTDAWTINAAGLSTGLILKRGDRLSVLQGDLVVHRWVAANLVVSSAISQNIQLTPRLPIGVLAADAVVVLRDPKMRFMIVPGSWDGEEVANPSPITFEVSEALR